MSEFKINPEAEKLIKEYDIILLKDEKIGIQNTRKFKKGGEELREKIISMKPIIIETLKEMAKRTEWEIRQKENERKMEYESLKRIVDEKQLPAINHDPKKEAKLKKEIKDIENKMRSFIGDEESDGIIAHLSSRKSELQQELMKVCNHDFKVRYNYTHTPFAKKKIEKIITCEKCGLHVVYTAEEE
jgi:C4-type Zn-finger protein